MKFYNIKSYAAVLFCFAAAACSDGGQFVQISKIPASQRVRVGESNLPVARTTVVSGATSDSLAESVGSGDSEKSVVVAGTAGGSSSALPESPAANESPVDSPSGSTGSGGREASSSTGSSSGEASGSKGSDGSVSEGTSSVGHDCGDDHHDDCEEKEGSRKEKKTSDGKSKDKQHGGCDRGK